MVLEPPIEPPLVLLLGQVWETVVTRSTTKVCPLSEPVPWPEEAEEELFWDEAEPLGFIVALLLSVALLLLLFVELLPELLLVFEAAEPLP